MRNGPFYVAKWAVLACKMGRFATPYNSAAIQTCPQPSDSLPTITGKAKLKPTVYAMMKKTT